MPISITGLFFGASAGIAPGIGSAIPGSAFAAGLTAGRSSTAGLPFGLSRIVVTEAGPDSAAASFFFSFSFSLGFSRMAVEEAADSIAAMSFLSLVGAGSLATGFWKMEVALPGSSTTGAAFFGGSPFLGGGASTDGLAFFFGS
ncbi:MAG: hypothetical protein ACRD5I_12790, partial [Candidatus Acidiferrales bacterium]